MSSDITTFHDHQKDHRMPRVLFVATRKPRIVGYGLLMDKMTQSLDCICLKFVARHSDWVIPEQLGVDAGVAVEKALRHAQDTGKPYDLIFAQSPEVANEIAQITSEKHGMPYQPPVVIQRPADHFCKALDIKTAGDLREAGYHAFSDTEMETTPESLKNKTVSQFDQQIALALGDEGIKRLECSEDQSVPVQWGENDTTDSILSANGAPVERGPDQRTM